MRYTDQGKRSKVWWLQAVKMFGEDGVMGIMRGAYIESHVVKAAMVDLEKLGFIDRIGGGTGQKLYFELASDGLAYFDEHQAELEEPPEIPKDDSSIRHQIVAAPVFQGTSMTENPDRTSTELASINKPTPVTSPPKVAQSQISDDKPKVSNSIDLDGQPEKDIVRPAIHDIRASLNPSSTCVEYGFAASFREILIEILLEKYAHNVTAHEVMERLELGSA